MKSINILAVAAIAFIVLITGCTKEIETNNHLSTQTLPTNKSVSTLSSIELPQEAKAKLSRLRSTLPVGYEQRLKKNSALLLKKHPEYRDMVLRAMNVTAPSLCDGNAPLHQWLIKELTGWEDVFFYALV